MNICIQTVTAMANLYHTIKSKHEQFLQSRRGDQSIKERERALQSLDLAYHKYREITRNLDEGLKVGDILINFAAFANNL